MCLWRLPVNLLCSAAHQRLAATARGAVRARHSRPEEVGEAQRHKMMNRPAGSYGNLTGRTGKQEFFLMSPTAPGMSSGRSKAASDVRGKMGGCSSWQEVVDLVNTAKAQGKLEASVLGAAMQTCGNRGWWEGLLELHKMRQEEAVGISRILGSIALTALTHCLKDEHNCRRVQVTDRVPVALAMAKQFWREVEPAGDVLTFNVLLSSALKLATCLDCEEAYIWGSELWDEPNQRFDRNQVSFDAYLAFLEHYRRCDEVNAILTRTHAVDVVLLGSLLNCTASHRDWQRAEVLWETFSRREVEPNLMAHNNRAKVHLLAGRPGKVLEIYDHAIMDFVAAMAENYKVGANYAQALLLFSHSSLELGAIERLQSFLARALMKGPARPKSFREDLRKMRSVAEKLQSEPEEVYLHDVLIGWNAKEQSVMARWKNYPAGSNYLEDQCPL